MQRITSHPSNTTSSTSHDSYIMNFRAVLNRLSGQLRLGLMVPALVLVLVSGCSYSDGASDETSQSGSNSGSVALIEADQDSVDTDAEAIAVEQAVEQADEPIETAKALSEGLKPAPLDLYGNGSDTESNNDEAAGNEEAGTGTEGDGERDIVRSDEEPEPEEAPGEDMADSIEYYVPTGASTDAAGLAAAEQGALGKPSMVFFHADWCHVCQEIAPEYAAIQDTHANDIAFIKMNVDDPASGEAKGRYGVRGTPTFVAFDATGKVVQSYSGWPGAARVDQLLSSMAN